MSTKKEWHYFNAKGVQIELKLLSDPDLVYLIDLLIEELSYRIDGPSYPQSKKKGKSHEHRHL